MEANKQRGSIVLTKQNSSLHAYIDGSHVYVRHSKPKREYLLPKGYLELLEQKRYSPSIIKTCKIYFSDFVEYRKGSNIDCLKVADINCYILQLDDS